jgi:hypothetical protein
MPTRISCPDHVTAGPPVSGRSGKFRVTVLLVCAIVGASGCAQGSSSGKPSGSGSTSPSASESPSAGVSTTVTGADGALVLVVPSSWMAADTTWTPSKKKIPEPALVASTDPALLGSDWTRDGVFIGASPALAKELDIASTDLVRMLALAEWHGKLNFEDCERDGASSFEHNGYEGFETFWNNCGGIGTKVYDVGVATPELDAVLHVLVQVSADSPLGDEDIDAILDGFEYHG